MEAARLQTCPVRGPEQRGEINNVHSVALKHREGGLGERSSTGTRARREGEERRANERFHAFAVRTREAGTRRERQRHPAGSGSIYQVAKEQKGAEKREQLSAGPSSLLCLRE